MSPSAFLQSLKLLTFIPAFIFGLLLSSCGDTTAFLSPEKQTEATGNFSASYHLGPGDTVKLSIYEEPDLSGEYQVSGSNTISVPLAGEVQVGGMPLREASLAIESALQEGFLRNPQISLEIVKFRPFYILGEVRTPGSYDYQEGINVLNAVALAGGFTYRAGNNKVKIVRPGAGKPELLVTDVYTPVFPGDVIYIQEKIF